MPSTSMPLRKKLMAAVEITALAAGAGPPANRIATRLKSVGVCFGTSKGDDIGVGLLGAALGAGPPQGTGAGNRSVRPTTEHLQRALLYRIARAGGNGGGTATLHLPPINCTRAGSPGTSP